MTRPILTPRRPGVERLISDLPGEQGASEAIRRFAQRLIGEANAWQIDRAKEDARLRGIGRQQHG